MASNLALARSFYAWLAKIEMNETGDLKKILPKTYPTSPEGLYLVSSRLCEDFWDTPHYIRACYWNEIFESTAGKLDEGIRQKLLGFAKGLFTPKKDVGTEVNKGFVLRKLEAFLHRLKTTYDQIDQGRKGFPVYNTLRRQYTEQENEALARSVDWLHPEGVSVAELKAVSKSQRKTKLYSLACLRIALGSLTIGAGRSILTLGMFSKTAWVAVGGSTEFTGSAAREIITKRLGVIEATVAVVIYLVTAAFGEQNARDIFPS